MTTEMQARFLCCARDVESGARVGSQERRAALLEVGILVSQPSPRGDGAPKERIGHRRYEREWDEDRKLLIKGRKQSFTWLVLFTLLSFGSRFRGEEAASPPFFIGAMPGSGI